MRQLLPVPLDPADPAEVYGDLPTAAGRPGVRLNMIASVDGATTVAGVSGGLGGAADHELFGVLRSLADVVLVAAGTVRAEGYRPSRVPVAVVTRSCRLDWDAPFFSAQIARPVVVTVTAAPAEARARAAEVADVVLAGEHDVDLARVLGALGGRGAAAVLAEGGPSLNGQLARAGLLDELCLTLSPRLVGGFGKRILEGSTLPAPRELRLHTLCEQDGFLFLRLRPAPPAGAELQ
ncbi:MAG TPA: dihydrofolate reductase family protein [Actinomycetes bacterium]|nr:dihydrofolate reductase family protein [Actinomycetes bacterium]